MKIRTDGLAVEQTIQSETFEEEEENTDVTGGRRDATEPQLLEDVNRWRNVVD
jgi:hypothetical protein